MNRDKQIGKLGLIRQDKVAVHALAVDGTPASLGPGTRRRAAVVQASNRGHRRRPLRPQLDLAQHLPDPLDQGRDVDPAALLYRAILLLVTTGERPRSRATQTRE